MVTHMLFLLDNNHELLVTNLGAEIVNQFFLEGGIIK